MTWLVTGATGQLGTAFRRALLGKQNVCFANRSICDLGNPSKLSACLERETPDVIINCAAYTPSTQLRRNSNRMAYQC